MLILNNWHPCEVDLNHVSLIQNSMVGPYIFLKTSNNNVHHFLYQCIEYHNISLLFAVEAKYKQANLMYLIWYKPNVKNLLYHVEDINVEGNLRKKIP